ncbi:hypothetical protein [Fimbriimonas ginsengisoli]|uniref:hypothetical protein n=1 Tax=Fimbriimonas ginsengisoli TaxID=1005039 RepID=UPI00118576ED|nr:hypothetical protein [Fimbriimonas ginsengisoli]
MKPLLGRTVIFKNGPLEGMPGVRSSASAHGPAMSMRPSISNIVLSTQTIPASRPHSDPADANAGFLPAHATGRGSAHRQGFGTKEWKGKVRLHCIDISVRTTLGPYGNGRFGRFGNSPGGGTVINEPTPTHKQCPTCGTVSLVAAAVCPNCNHHFRTSFNQGQPSQASGPMPTQAFGQAPQQVANYQQPSGYPPGTVHQINVVQQNNNAALWIILAIVFAGPLACIGLLAISMLPITMVLVGFGLTVWGWAETSRLKGLGYPVPAAATTKVAVGLAVLITGAILWGFIASGSRSTPEKTSPRYDSQRNFNN